MQRFESSCARRSCFKNLSKDIRSQRAEHCRRGAETADTASTKDDFLDMERRWLSLARSYEFAERLSDYTAPFRRRKQ
jgi:hypothetical protein